MEAVLSTEYSYCALLSTSTSITGSTEYCGRLPVSLAHYNYLYKYRYVRVLVLYGSSTRTVPYYTVSYSYPVLVRTYRYVPVMADRGDCQWPLRTSCTCTVRVRYVPVRTYVGIPVRTVLVLAVSQSVSQSVSHSVVLKVNKVSNNFFSADRDRSMMMTWP